MRAIWLVLAACGSSTTPTSNKGGVSVELASVTLADDCGDSGFRQPPAALANMRNRVEPAGDQAKEDRQASCPKGADCNFNRRGCAQTSMQLSLRADEATTVKVKKVELLDDGGAPIIELPSRLPTRWTGSGYTAWDEKLAANTTAQTSYALEQPPWEKLGGRMKAQTKKYQLRVTLEVGGASHTVEKQSIAPALMEPEVMTRREIAPIRCAG